MYDMTGGHGAWVAVIVDILPYESTLLRAECLSLRSDLPRDPCERFVNHGRGATFLGTILGIQTHGTR